MSATQRVIGGIVDSFTMPISYAVKGFTGRSIGDYVVGEDFPPPTNGPVKGVIAYVIDGFTAPVSLITKAFTGNTVGDYLTGDTIAKRQAAEQSDLAQEQLQVQARQEARSRQRTPSMQQGHVQAPSLGQQQEQSRAL